MKILVYLPNWLGDVIFTTPLFQAVKEHFKGCSIGCVVTKRCADVLRYNPHIDELIIFDERKKDRCFFKTIKFILSLRAKKYEMAIMLHRSLTRLLFCYLAGIGKRVGYAYTKRSFLLTHSVPIVDKDSMHKQDYYLGVARAIGIDILNDSCKVYLSDIERTWAKETIDLHQGTSQYLIGISPITNWHRKDWPVSYYDKLIKILKKELGAVKFFLTSNESNSVLASFVAHNKNSVVDLTGKTDLLNLMALYEKLDLVISGDSGPLHLAASLGTKYLGLYGPTSPFLTGPRTNSQGAILFKNKDCQTPCYSKECNNDYLCIGSITPQEASERALNLLDQPNLNL